MQSEHVKGLACFRSWSAPAGFTPHAFRCAISNALMLDLGETVVFSNTSASLKIHTDNIMNGMDDNLSIIFILDVTRTQQVKSGLPRFAPPLLHLTLSSGFKVV